MGKRGPPAKPDSLKKQQGTFRAGRSSAGRVFELAPGAPPTPDDLPSAALKLWTHLLPRLLMAGVLSDVDGGTLESYVRMHARAVHLDHLAARAPMLRTSFGLRINPAAGEARKLWQVVHEVAGALGLHYAARSRVRPPDKDGEEDKDSAESFLFGRPRVIEGGKN